MINFVRRRARSPLLYLKRRIIAISLTFQDEIHKNKGFSEGQRFGSVN